MKGIIAKPEGAQAEGGEEAMIWSDFLVEKVAYVLWTWWVYFRDPPLKGDQRK